VPARWRLAVCKGKDCRRGRSDDLFRSAGAEAARLGIGPDLSLLERGGCYGLCELGPNIVLRDASIGSPDDPLWAGHFRLLHVPGEFHYWRMDADKLRRVLAEHVAGGRPASDLLCPPEKWPGR
jgi:(2Fe-2S) ferredoxin